MAQEDPTDQVAWKRQTLAEIRAEIDRLYSPPVDDDPSPENDDAVAGPPVQPRARRRLVVGVVTATVGIAAIAALLMGTPRPRQEHQDQSKAAVTMAPPAAPWSPVVSEPHQSATDIGGVPDPGATSDDEGALRESLDNLLAATNQRDLSGVLAFYPERVPRFYRALDVPRDVVAADKAWQFRRATVLDIRRTGDVALTIDPAR